MPRNYRRTRKQWNDTRMNFKQLCNAIGINPQQRIILIRWLKKEGEPYNK